MNWKVVLVAAAAVAYGQEQLPRFRAGANLVSVDAYFSKSGAPVADLKPDDLEILEDDEPQKVESFRMVKAGGPARVFVLFFDHWHVSTDGSRKASAPISAFLNRIVGVDDLVGVTTPDLPARGLSLTRRTEAIERAVRDTTNWGQRDSIDTIDPRDREIFLCYPDNDLRRPQFRGVAREMIERRREQKTLRALDELIAHLATLRDERKFVVLLSEGWVLFRQSDSFGAILEPGSAPTLPGVSSAYDRAFESCERERSLLAFVDHTLELRQLAQRANRANVTFFVVDPRGLAAFDDAIGPMRPATPAQDRDLMSSRQEGLRDLAYNTDGAVVLDTNDVKTGLARMMADLNTYYLMQYYSTNTRLDGRFRKITVRVKQPGVQVRARPGYLAPTEAEAAAAGVPIKPASLPEGTTKLIRRTPVTALRRGPSTGLKFVVAGDPLFRRTERLRVEIPIASGATDVAGRVLTIQQQPMPLVVTASTQETNGQLFGIAEVILAPLAVGQYVLEVSYSVNEKKEAVPYSFRIVP